jgi:hypothetical protein
MADKKEKVAKAPKEQQIKEDKGAEAPTTILPYKVSKIIIHPSRKFGLKNYSSVELSAGMEIVFDKPQDINGQVVKDAYINATKKLQEEFRRQLEAFGTKKKEKPSAAGGDGNK